MRQPIEVIVKTEGTKAVKVAVGGVDITDRVRSVRAFVGVGELPTVDVEMPARDGLDLTFDAHVCVSVTVHEGCVLERHVSNDGRTIRYRAFRGTRGVTSYTEAFAPTAPEGEGASNP